MLGTHLSNYLSGIYWGARKKDETLKCLGALKSPTWSCTRLFLIIFYDVCPCISYSSHVIVMSVAVCVSLLGGKPLNVAGGKKRHPTSQIKAVIVTPTTTKANERQIGYRNKHFGDTCGATLQWECGHRLWVTLSPLGRRSAGRNLGMGQGACCCLVL